MWTRKIFLHHKEDKHMYDVVEKMVKVQECIGDYSSAATKVTHSLRKGGVKEIIALGLELEIDGVESGSWFIFKDYEDKLTKDNFIMFFYDQIKDVEIHTDVITITLRSGEYMIVENVSEDLISQDRWDKIEGVEA